MIKKQKILEMMRNNPKNISFELLRNFLESKGYVARNTGGSHWVFNKLESPTFTVPYSKPIKAIYVKQILRLLGESQND